MASFTQDALKEINNAQDWLNNNNPLTADQRSQLQSDGFLVPPAYSADSNNLPYTQAPFNHSGQVKRNIVTWFIPEFGIVRMFINPQSMSYQYKKLISRERTKGGFSLQYWGEDLTIINLQGTTGSSGIEGINMLYEMYRAEQYAFDAVGLTLAASNASADLASKAVNYLGGVIGGGLNSIVGNYNNQNAQGLGSGILAGVLGLDSANNNALAARNINSLAQLAFTVEMYYNGWVHRGFFENMTVNEQANDFLLNYQITFVSTQRRGYRVNYFPWSRTPTQGPSNYATPYSYNLWSVSAESETQNVVSVGAFAL